MAKRRPARWREVGKAEFLNPARDGAVLPILHLNGYKISGPTVTARWSDEELSAFYRGCGYTPYFVEGDDPAIVHQQLAAALDRCYAEIRETQKEARTKDASASGKPTLKPWPMIILRTPKGWTCPKEVDGLPIEGTFRAHQVPLANVRENPAPSKLLEDWMRAIPARKIVRSERPPDPGTRRARAGRQPTHGRKSARERRTRC